MFNYLLNLSVLLCFLILGACSSSPSEKKTELPEGVTIEVNKPAPKEMILRKGALLSSPIQGGDIYTFNFELEADQFVHIEALQKGIDFKMVLILPENDSSLIFDTPNGQEGIEDLFYLTDRGGTYSLTLTPFSDYAEPASFDIMLKTVRDASPEDRAWIQLYDKMRVADQMRKKKETLADAVAAFEKLIPQWREIGDTYQEAVARRSLGYTLRSLGEFEKAKKTFTEVLPLWQDLEETRYEAFTFLILAGIYKSQKAFDKAIPLTFEAIEKWQDAGDIVQESRAYSDVASFYMMIGDHEKSQKYYDKSIEVAEESGSLSVQGIMLREYGNAWQTFGDDEKVLEYYSKALDKYQQMGHPSAQALVLRMMGDFLYNKGKMAESKDYFEQAYTLYLKLGDEKMTISMKSKVQMIKESM